MKYNIKINYVYNKYNMGYIYLIENKMVFINIRVIFISMMTQLKPK